MSRSNTTHSLRRPLWIVSAIIAAITVAQVPEGNTGRQTLPPEALPQPAIPEADRYANGHVFLEQADKLLKTAANADYQVVTGNVIFRRGDMYMYCDSAHFYDATSSLEAFGNIKMEQGDTLFVYADELEYTDSTQLAVLYSNPGKKVRLINRNVELKTDIFNYDMGIELGYYDVGGELYDGTNRLTSLYGEYAPNTKDAIFRRNVHLEGLREGDTLNIWTQSLFYNTDTKIAELDDESRITSRDGVIYTTSGTYNTDSEIADLYDHSLVITSTGRTLEGDTLFYDRRAGYGQAWGNMVLNDTVNRMKLKGDYGFYNELTDSAFVTGHAIAVDYSQPDSLSLHGDTIQAFLVITQVEKKNIPSPTATAEHEPGQDNVMPIDSKLIVDATPFDSTLIVDATPFDSTFIEIEDLSIYPDSLMQVDTSIDEPQQVETPTDEDLGTEPSLEEETDTVNVEETQETDAGPVEDDQETIVANVEPVVETVPDSTHYIVAYPNVRFYRVDLQGVCDSMTFIQRDSLLYLDIDPVVWNGERQVTGTTITVHLNDSTVDRMTIPSDAFLAENLGEGFYNQLSGRELVATLENGELTHVDVSGNVLIIYFPMEEDSTYNKVANAESSFLAADFKDRELVRLKMWPQSNETITPLYLAKKTLFKLPGLNWRTEGRPTGHNDVLPRTTVEATDPEQETADTTGQEAADAAEQEAVDASGQEHIGNTKQEHIGDTKQEHIDDTKQENDNDNDHEKQPSPSE